jgi:hypothetical protein
VCYVLSPPPPTDLKLEAATTSSLKIKWEHPPEQTKLSYTVSIKVWGHSVCFSQYLIPFFKEMVMETNKQLEEMKQPVETNSATIQKLASGQVYLVSVVNSVKVADKTYESSAVVRWTAYNHTNKNHT